MKSLTVFFDSQCGVCRVARRWLTAQPLYLPMQCVPLDQAKEVHPDLAKFQGGEEFIVVSDAGEIWRGDAAFITCLWATRRYRRLATRLARPALRPLARTAFSALSTHRRGISKWMNLGDAELAADLRQHAKPMETCSDLTRVHQQLRRTKQQVRVNGTAQAKPPAGDNASQNPEGRSS